MAKFKYEGIDATGALVKGDVEAENEKDVRKYLRANNIRAKKISPPSLLEIDLNQWLLERGIGNSVPLKTLSLFTKQLSVMISAGVPILQALDILKKSEKNIALKMAVSKIATDVGEGKTIFESMSKQSIFSKLYCSLVKAGELGGILDDILIKLSIHMEKIEKTKQKIKSALTYPTIVVVVGIVVVWILMVWVVPQFVGMLTESGKEIPAITQFVINVSEFFSSYTIIMIPAVIVLFFVFMSWKKTKEGKKAWDQFVMKVPLFGEIVIKGNLAAFSNTLATLLSSGVTLIDALDVCIETIDNVVVASDISEVRKKVTEGQTLSQPLSKIEYFPELITQMIKVGEQTGQIDTMLAKVATVFEEEVDNLIETMTKMIEPLIIVVLGGIVATILVAMYLPMFMAAD